MKGMVFTEFLELVEDKFSVEIAEDLIHESNLPSGGAYTSVGSYDHGEILTLVTKLSERTGVPVNDLVFTFGHHLIERFANGYPDMFTGMGNTFEFLKTIHDHVHVEVKKLYPDAELPTISATNVDDHTLKIHYSSSRPFADLAHGLIAGVCDHFGEKIDISRKYNGENGSTEEEFTLVTTG